MKGWFSNISVAYKLFVGFGVVLILTCAMALTGWSSLGSVLTRTDRLNDIQELNSAMTTLRIVRLQYMLSRGDERLAQTVQQAYDAYEREYNEAVAVFTRPENAALLKKQGVMLSDYARTLQKVREAYGVSAAARNEMGDYAEKLMLLMDEVEQGIGSLRIDDERRAECYQAISQAKEDIFLARFEVRGYINNSNVETDRVMAQQLQRAAASVKRLVAVFSAGGGKQALDLVALYEEAVSRFRVANASNEKAREELEITGSKIIKVNEQLLQNQLVSLDDESGAARDMQILVALLVVFLGGGAAWVITRQITGPLHEALDVVGRIASGDLSQVQGSVRRDELGELHRGVQRMGGTLRDLISAIRDGVAQIASSAEELSAVTQQTSAGVNNQKVETDQVATAVHEMSATVQEVARNAESASQAATLADTEAKAGERVVVDAISHIERLAAEVSRSSDAMEHLQQESNKIGSVMDVIKSVAEQTNLLALNAAIEAARAGEAGRGFAVVADEVRGLALRTQKSTEEIEELIIGLQQEAEDVALMMVTSRNLTDSSVQLARKAGGALGIITGNVSNIQSMNQQIAAAAEQQSAVTEEINHSIINVREVSEQTASASEQTAASTVELARLGHQLQIMVSHFRF